MRSHVARLGLLLSIALCSACPDSGAPALPVDVAAAGIGADGSIIPAAYPLIVPIAPGSELEADAIASAAASAELDRRCREIVMTSELDAARPNSGCPRQLDVPVEAIGVNQ